LIQTVPQKSPASSAYVFVLFQDGHYSAMFSQCPRGSETGNAPSNNDDPHVSFLPFTLTDDGSRSTPLQSIG
jgi:hypothetical protein